MDASDSRGATVPHARRFTWIKLIAKMLCAALIAGLILWVAGILILDRGNSITGNTMRDLYAQERVSVLLLGSSTVYESCVPSAFDAEDGENAFNAATPAQTLRESFHQLREVCRLYEPERVLLGLSPPHLMNPIERDSLSASYLFDNMRWSPVKLGFMRDAFDPDYYPSALFPVVRLRGELTTKDLTAAVFGRASDANDSGDPAQDLASSLLRYDGRGYVANLQVIENGTLPEAPPLGFTGSDSVARSALDHLSRIIGFCKSEGIELTLFQTPLLPGATEWVGDYAAYHDALARVAEDAGVDFLDFNYISPEVITYDDSMFSDLEHLTDEAAHRFSGVFASLLTAGGGDGGVFLGDYEAYREQYRAVASTWVTEARPDGAQVASIGTVVPEYRVAVLTDDDAMDVVLSTDWQTGDTAQYDELSPGDYIVTVEARPFGDDDAEPKGNWTELHVD
jgi:hypothetical protein